MRAVRSLVAASLLALILGAIAIGTILFGRPVPTTLDPVPEPVYLTLEPQQTVIGRSAVVRLQSSMTPQLRATGASGTVTKVSAKPGAEVGPGDAVYWVDGRAIYLVRSQEPLYRELKLSDRGPDVTAMQEFLVSDGANGVTSDGVFGPATARAWAAWLRQQGLPSDTPFAPTHFIAVPSEVTIDQVKISVGAQAPAIGESVLSVIPDLALDGVDVDGLPIAGVESYVLVDSGAQILDLDIAGADWVATNPDQLRAAAARPTPDEARGLDSTDEAEADPQSALSDARSIRGYLQTREPVPTVSVPGSSILVGDQGQQCILVRRAAGSLEAAAATVLGVTPNGSALLAPGPLGEGEVLVNPTIEQRQQPCP